MAGCVPKARPFRRIAQLSLGVRAAAGDETGKRAAAGRLADWVVAQVEAPADVVAVVGVRGVNRQFVHQQRVPTPHRHGSGLAAEQLTGDLQAIWARAMVEQTLAMALRP